MSQVKPSIIDPLARIGHVSICVSDLARSEEFYVGALGFQVASREPGRLTLGAAGGDVLLELLDLPGAVRKPRGTTGLFHFAILVPSRYDLSRSLRRLVQVGWPLSGASDHGVSEALYLDDPDGNGIEIYRDRPRYEWRVLNGLYAMITDPLDLGALYAESEAADVAPGLLAAGTRIGHVHLQVADLDEARRFYVDGLRLEIVATYPSALFVAAGRYHHHVGLNTWGTRGGNHAPANAVGLASFEVLVSSSQELARIAERLSVEAEDLAGEGVAEPSGARLRVRVAV